ELSLAAWSGAWRDSSTTLPRCALEVRNLSAAAIPGAACARLAVWRARPAAGYAQGSRCTRLRRRPKSEPTFEEVKAKLAQMEKEKEGRRSGSLEFRVGEKGGVSVYGLGRFPVTLYYEQWMRLLDAAPDLRKFLDSAKSDGKLKLKEK